jgi:hypothetical protein
LKKFWRWPAEAGRISFLAAAFALAGCASLVSNAPVVFDDPAARLNIRPSQPDPEELERGVTLRFRPPVPGRMEYREDHRVFARIRDGKGSRLNWTMNRREIFSAAEPPESFRLRAESEVQGERGRLTEETVLDSRGKIIRFIEARHRSRAGDFDVAAWQRDPVFPKDPVRPGDRWSYGERLELRVKSFWLKDLEPAPLEMKAESELEGFAVVNGRRCAVIRTSVRQLKRHHFRVLFREVIFNLHADIDETLYFNLADGYPEARVVRSKSYTEGLNIALSDQGQSQSVVVRTA